MILQKLTDRLRSPGCWAVLDPSDNSVTLSEKLFERIRNEARNDKDTSVFVFAVRDTFGFIFDPKFDTPTQLCAIQYNGQYKCIGFETLCPSVGQMFYKWGLPAEGKVKVSVGLRRTKDGKRYYQFHKPYGKRNGNK